MARRELSDDEWVLVEPLLPIGAYGPCPHRLRDQLEGVIWKPDAEPSAPLSPLGATAAPPIEPLDS